MSRTKGELESSSKMQVAACQFKRTVEDMPDVFAGALPEAGVAISRNGVIQGIIDADGKRLEVEELYDFEVFPEAGCFVVTVD